MLRLLALLSLLVPAGLGLGFADREAHPSSPRPDSPALPHERALDVRSLPLPNGWIVFRLVASEATPFEVEAEVGSVEPVSSGFADALVFGNASSGYAMGGGSGSSVQLVEASHGGHAVRCCSEAVTSASWSGGKASIGGDLQPGEHWLALLVAEARRYDLQVTLRTAHDVVQVDAPVVGRTVESVDLAGAARDATTRVTVGGTGWAAPGGAASRAWSPAGSGFLMLNAHAQGDASARLAVEVPGEAPFSTRLRESFLNVVAFGPGAFSVGLKDLDEPLAVPPLARPNLVVATVLYADLPLAAHEHHVTMNSYG